MPDSPPVLVWFRNDLRLTDNPALHAAVETGQPVICLYILETPEDGLRPLGGASKWWLDKSLRALARDIADRGGRLILRRGRSATVIDNVIAETGAGTALWNRRYDLGGRTVDGQIKSALQDRGVEVQSFNGSLLTEPWTLAPASAPYYRVFSPYWKAVRATYAPPAPLLAPKRLDGIALDSDDLEDWKLHPSRPDWSTGFDALWTPGEAGAAERLNAFLSGPVNAYHAERDLPAKTEATSGLSPHLRWGEIGPAQVWRSVAAGMEAGTIVEKPGWKFLSEVGWREFSYVLLFHNPELAETNYNSDFRHMPWRENEADLAAWQRGETGFPLVDAGMRQLWQTGWMHNRVRMVVASFLTKHLLIPWQRGEDWFWDTLVDADPASNAASWQWVAGSGADAAPYFRVFNPISQGEKFDPDGDYVRRWCPQLAGLSNKHIHAPWQADDLLQLPADYPDPIVDHMTGRQRALDAYDTLKERRANA